MVVQTSLVCETRDSVATIVASSAFTCFQEILTEVDEVNENIQEILTEVDENGDNIQEIIDLFVTPGCNFKWNEKKHIDMQYRLFSLKFICRRDQRNNCFETLITRLWSISGTSQVHFNQKVFSIF